MAADAEASWDVGQAGPYTHLRVRILPDGGIARLRAFGVASDTLPFDAPTALNGMAESEAVKALTRCCSSSRWVRAMCDMRPFTSRAHLFGAADSVWWHLDQRDWLEAFDGHPKIGASKAKGWSEGEQAGMASAEQGVRSAISELNTAYQNRYGYIYIVCATGLSAAEMLARLEHRMSNTPENELRIAAGEQAKISRIRLTKLLEET